MANGLGGVEIDHGTIREDPTKGETAGGGDAAIRFFHEAVQRFGDDVTTVPTGALTTVAEAMKRYEDVAHARIVLMGGALTVPGNVSAVAEADDFPGSRCRLCFCHCTNITMVGLDVTLQTLLTKEHTKKWREQGTRAGTVYADIVDYYIDAYATTSPHLGGCGLHDPLAVAVALDPRLVSYLDTNLKVDCSGRTIGNEQRVQDLVKRNHVAVIVDAERFVGGLMVRVGRLFETAG